MSSFRQRVGCWLHERWRAELVMAQPRLAATLGMSWRSLRNRSERLRADQRTGGMECLWQDSSVLTASRLFPRVGVRLLAHVLQEWPIRFETAPARPAPAQPLVSILVPVGGQGRMPQFRLALAAARAQAGVPCEVVVVEQSPEASLRQSLPADVRYVHQPQDERASGFNKSRALNLAAQEARGESLIILDADYLLPIRFAQECHRVLQDVEGARPARLLFYLDEASTGKLATGKDLSGIDGLEKVVANNPTPIALRHSTYWEIGGHDEAYVGWGGEDLEFLDRLRSRRVSEAGWMPVVHAWHAPAEKKASGDRNRELHLRRMAIPRAERIRMGTEALAGRNLRSARTL
jgi:hypothetical protein